MSFLILSIISILTCQVAGQRLENHATTTAELVRQRGYIAENHYVVTPDGYILNLVRAINPLMNHRTGRAASLRTPVIFIHGTATNANCFLINSRGARPKDYRYVDVNSMSNRQLNLLLARDPARFSVPFTLLNFGHEVWLLNRRGTFQSTGHVRRNMQPFRTSARDVARLFRGQFGRPRNLLNQLTMGLEFLARLFIPGLGINKMNMKQVQQSVNANYWNFSLDEQAKYDFPSTLNYVLMNTNTRYSKAIIVGHSLGSTIPLMALSMSSNLDNKIHRSLLYSPALYNRGTVYRQIGSIAAPILNSYVGPFPSSIIVDLARMVVDLACSNRAIQTTACSSVVQAFFGPDGGQDVVSSDAADIALDTFASHDIGQLNQCFLREKCHRYDFMSDYHNTRVYGRAEPTLYDVGKITSKSISLWNGNTDTLVPMISTTQLASEFRVPVERYLINEPGIYWNHVAYFFHTEIPRLLTVPSLKLISRPTMITTTRQRRDVVVAVQNATE